MSEKRTPRTPRARVGKTAGELMAELAQDPEYQARAAAREAERRALDDELGRAEAPIVRDLQELGLPISSVWDLVTTTHTYNHALPLLLSHLERGGYPDRVLESLGRAVAMPWSVHYWSRLVALYLAARGRGEQEGLAVALSVCAMPPQLDDLKMLLEVDTLGSSRVHLLDAIRRVSPDRGQQLLTELANHTIFGTEARALLKKNRRLKHPPEPQP